MRGPRQSRAAHAAWMRRLAVAAAERYRGAGRFAVHFARGKLRADPVFAALLRPGLLPERARLLDLGCGQGLLAAWLHAAHDEWRAGSWPPRWPPPPEPGPFRGIELMPRDVERARLALGDRAAIEQGDIRSREFAHPDVIVILDVLHYLERDAQRAVLRRARAALPRRGTLLLRIGDAAAGLPFRVSTWIDAAVIRVRGHGRVRLHCRPLAAWSTLLEEEGFHCEARPMGSTAFYANVLLVARPG